MKRPVAIALTDHEAKLLVIAVDMAEAGYRSARLKAQGDDRAHADRQIKRLRNLSARLLRARLRNALG